MIHNRNKRNYIKNNKHKYNLTKTTNLNNFLLTLDKMNREKDVIDLTIDNTTNKENKTNEEIVKNAINKIIQNTEYDYNVNNTSNTYNDPNIYTDQKKFCDNLNNSCVIKNPFETNIYKKPLPILINDKILEKKKQPENIKKEKKNIIAEISNIRDILDLIDKYPLEDGIEYNINMEGLHNIKSSLHELNEMIGMESLKSSIVDQILYFSQGLHKNKDSSGEFLHTVIYGPPGTGKTEIAKIMGKIYSNLGILSKSSFTKVTRSDLVAGYLGQTALKTKEVIKEALGGVLFIDEAYALGNPEKRDSFSKECIDTLCEALSDYKEDLMVIIAGYEDDLRDSFFSSNKGLDSRFMWRFKTDEYKADELLLIFIKMIKDIGWENNIEEKILLKWFERNKEYFEYFGRDIQSLLAKTKIAHSKRVFCLDESEKRKITMDDLDKGFHMFSKNDNVIKRKNDRESKRYIYNTLYS